MRTQAESGSNAYRAKPFAIMEKEVAGRSSRSADKDAAAAEQLIKEADGDRADARRAVGSGRADQAVVRAVRRVAAASSNRPAEAAAQFQQALTRMPNRRAALEGLKRATAAKTTTAAQGR